MPPENEYRIWMSWENGRGEIPNSNGFMHPCSIWARSHHEAAQKRFDLIGDPHAADWKGMLVQRVGSDSFRLYRVELVTKPSFKLTETRI